MRGGPDGHSKRSCGKVVKVVTREDESKREQKQYGRTSNRKKSLIGIVVLDRAVGRDEGGEAGGLVGGCWHGQKSKVLL